MAYFIRVVYALLGSIQPWLATMAHGKFYKVDNLAVETKIPHNYQVLLSWWDLRILCYRESKIFQILNVRKQSSLSLLVRKWVQWSCKKFEQWKLLIDPT